MAESWELASLNDFRTPSIPRRKVQFSDAKHNHPPPQLLPHVTQRMLSYTGDLTREENRYYHSQILNKIIFRTDFPNKSLPALQEAAKSRANTSDETTSCEWTVQHSSGTSSWVLSSCLRRNQQRYKWYAMINRKPLIRLKDDSRIRNHVKLLTKLCGWTAFHYKIWRTGRLKRMLGSLSLSARVAHASSRGRKKNKRHALHAETMTFRKRSNIIEGVIKTVIQLQCTFFLT